MLSLEYYTMDTSTGRLRQLATSLGVFHAASAFALPRKIRQHDDGRPLEEDMEVLRQQELAAAAAADYRAAAILHSTYEALREKPPMNVEDIMDLDGDDEAQHEFFLEHGQPTGLPSHVPRPLLL